ncbi:MAG: Uncharacterized NifU-like protein MSMEG_2718 [uncultured Propionibacteriaceae bacterium]|uniref:Uncharacterized NifU-like protein MSMEG_2718 n=1 Tax=uncultured Propionibacteriaceae bacterium TaxID=257457 RepID=A0A6J4P5T7_9ACTN|nr:MAG: Uncharacterized NifU-like protein MSMEG_2718 [uncultured Propionibacteriaceae bacterium]
MSARPESLDTRPEPARPDLRAAGERIDVLLNASASGGPAARERSEELVRLVTDLYGAGLERMMNILHETQHLDAGLLAALARDELVGSLLLVHGLHPYDVQTRVEQALDSVRPYLGTHGGDVELLGVTEDGTVRLRLLGSCDGCPSSSVTLKLAVEGAIEAAAPEITVIEVDTGATAAGQHGPVIPVETLRSRLHELSPELENGGTWHSVAEFAELAPGGVATTVVGEVPLLLCRVNSDLFAFRDRCSSCESSLAGAVLARRLGGAVGDALLKCPSCAAHYDVRLAGACLEVAGLHLEPLPLLANGTTVLVALPTTAAA